MEHKIISYSTSHIFFKITLIVLCFSNLGAATYYVSLSGNDNWPGTSPDSTWRHVAYATQQAQTGDSILVFEDTYEDEHAVFANSGSSENPIVLTAYNNTFTLDGIDNTGMAIRMVDKSYINISGFHIKNYGTGIRGEGLLTNLEISNFIIEDIAGEGVDFDGASLQNSVITDFTIRNTDGIAVTHFDYSSTDCHDVEISHFLIRDVNNEGINWRNTKRVHIHHGEIYNTASDGIHLQLNIDSSTVEYVRVDSTNWHGIAIHDHTVGDYPCSTNVIRYCYVANCGHNDIDLHSGAFNTVIEACTVGGPLTNGQAIYFHNLGAGLIVRNCVIQDVPGDGIDGGPSSGQYLRDILIENNSFYNLSCGIRLQGATENITIRGNRIYNTPYDIQVGAYNILIDSNYTENGYYRINGNDGRIFDALDTTYHARSAYGSFVTVGHTDGKVFKQENAGGYGPYTINKPMWYPRGSYFTMQADSHWCDVDINTYHMAVLPSTDSLEVLVIDWDTSGTYYKKWQEICGNPSVETSHEVGDFPIAALIKVKVNNTVYGIYLTGTTGWISFDYTSGFASDTVVFEAYLDRFVTEPELFVYPNPYKGDQAWPERISFGNLPAEAIIRIYTLSGDLVKKIEHQEETDGGIEEWDISDIASGVYIYSVKSTCGKKVGKVSIIK